MLTDEQVIDRAVAAGWTWFPNGNPRWGKYPLWETATSREGSGSISCSLDPASPYSRVATVRKHFDHDVNCRHCGKPADAAYDAFKRGRCFLCNFWMERVDDVPADKRVVVAGTHFTAGSWAAAEPPWGTTRFAGFGGRKFVVRFTGGPNAGQTLTTYDLWHQGEIPEHLRGLLPDNAEFAENTSAVQPAVTPA